MFKKLRLQLTLINVLITAVIFFLLFTAIYFMMARGMQWQTTQMMRLAAEEQLTPSGTTPKTLPEESSRWQEWIEKPDFFGPSRRQGAVERPGRGPGHFKYFYARADKSGKIIATSPNSPLAEKDVAALAGKALARKDSQGEIGYKEETYRFLITPVRGTGEAILIFMDTGMEKEVLHRLLGAFTLVGLGGLALSFFGSLFLSGKAMVPVKRSWQRQRDFVADASHELRTPLAVIQTNLEVVRGNPGETVESQSKWLGNIQAETKRMARLVEDLLLLARADSDQKLLEMKNFPLDPVMGEVVDSFEPLATEKGIRLEKEIDPNIIFFGDEARVKQLAVILLDNAVKHTPPGGLVKLSLKRQDTSLELSVSDTGEGIEDEHLGHIFKRFYRSDKARSRQEGGTGLGLSIAEWIVKSHRGTIRVSSTPGEGTVFSVVLPR